MARRAKVTQEAVNNACERLKADGKNPTINAVIAITGGSFSTVGVMLKAWRAEQALQADPLLNMPENVLQATQKAAAVIWEAASKQAGERVERTKQEAGEGIAKVQEELAEYVGEVSRLENELEGSRKTITATKDRLAEALEQLSTITNEKTALKTRLEDRDRALAQLRSDYEKLQSELLSIARKP